MDVVELLRRAAELVPADVVNEAGVTAADVREYLDHNEWEVALDLLADLYDGWRPSAQWWDLLIEAAELMWLSDIAVWCHWGRWESVHGVFRAELRLNPPAEGGRSIAIPRPGVLRPLWDIGQRTGAGEPDLRVARIWVEYATELPPGATGSIRLAPLSPADWYDLRPGQQITMHEGMAVGGTATVVEVVAPV